MINVFNIYHGFPKLKLSNVINLCNNQRLQVDNLGKFVRNLSEIYEINNDNISVRHGSCTSNKAFGDFIITKN